LLSGAGYAQQPPDVVISDSFQNTAMGTNALLNLMPKAGSGGQSNIASGYQALYSNTTGNNNTAFGSAALRLNTTGESNTASGSYALWLNTTGSSNTAIGLNALFFQLDRLLHHAHRLTLKGESLRRAGKPPKNRPDPDTIVTD
jgi:hypothetical protein